MSPNTTRWLISTTETFLAVFALTAGIMVYPTISQGQIPGKELLVAAAFAGMAAGIKAVAKGIREKLQKIIAAKRKGL